MKSFDRKRFLAILLLQIAVGVFGEGYYSVIAPGTLHSARKYNVAVAVHSTDDPCQLIVGITGPSYNATKTVELSEADEVKLLEFDVPELEKGDYNLTAEGVAGVEFKNSTKLSYAKIEPYVLIQTDKSAYKPGDVLQYRIIFFDVNLKPSAIEKTTRVWFEDSKRNLVKEIKDLKLVNGVYTGKFEISEFAVLGNWSITVKSGESGVSKQVSFQVDKSVLPKYVVMLEAKKRVAVQDGDMQAVVRANYTYGKPVNGKVTLLIEVLRTYWRGDDSTDKPEIAAVSKFSEMINGKAKFNFSVKEYENQIDRKCSSLLRITATVEEEFTGVKLSTSTGATLFPYRYQMMCGSYENCSTYHADKEAELAIKILHVDGSLPKDTKPIVRLKYVEAFRDITWWDPSQGEKPKKLEPPPPEKLKHFEFEGHLNDSSIAVIKVTLPNLEEIKGYQHYFKGTIEYAGEKTEVMPAFPYREPKEGDLPVVTNDEPKEYLKVDVKYEKDKYSINEGVESTVTVNSSKPMSYFVYTIVGRGNVLKIERVELPEPQKLSTFTFVPTFQMAPYGKIYIHYVQDGEYEYAETTFYVNWEFQNKIFFEAPEEIKVGRNIALTNMTAAYSFVGLLGGDQNVLLLRANKDASEDQVKWRLSQYATYTQCQAGFTRYPGVISGVVTLTNAHYFYNLPKPEWYAAAEYDSAGGLRKISVYKISAFGNANIESGSAASLTAMPSPTVRKDFAGTWFLANIENTETVSFEWIRKIPDTSTSRVATTKEITKRIIVKPYYVSMSYEHSVTREEQLSMMVVDINIPDGVVCLQNTDNEFEFTGISIKVNDVEKCSKLLIDYGEDYDYCNRN